MPTLRAPNARGRVPLLRRPGRRRPAHADHRPHRRRPRRGHGQPLARHRRSARTRRAASSARRSRPTAGDRHRRRAVVNATGVWADDVRALDEGGAPRTRSGRPRASTSPCRGRKVRNDIAAIVPVPKDKRSIFVVPWGDVHLHRHDRHGLRRPARRPRSAPPTTSTTCSTRSTSSSTEPLTEADVARHVGRAAAARRRRQRRREDRRPLARAQGVPLAESGSSPSPAASSRPTGGWPPTPSTRSSTVGSAGGGSRMTKRLRLLRRDRGRRARAMARRSAPTDEHLARPLRQPRRELLDLDRDDPGAGGALVPGLPYLPGRGGLRGAPRDGPHARRRALTPHPRPAPGSRRLGRGGASRSPSLIAPELGLGRGRGSPRDSGVADRDGPARPRPRSSAGLPEHGRSTNRSALDRLRRTHAADRARQHSRRSGARPPPATRVELDDALLRRLGDACATVLVDAGVGRRGEPGLVAAHHGLGARGPVAARAAAVRAPVEHRRGRRGARAVQRSAACRSPRRPGAAACAARACRCTAACCST